MWILAWGLGGEEWKTAPASRIARVLSHHRKRLNPSEVWDTTAAKKPELRWVGRLEKAPHFPA